MAVLSTVLNAAVCFLASLIPYILGLHSSPADTPKVRAILRGHKGSIMSIAFSPNGKLLASGSRDGTVILWDVATGKSVKRLEGDRVPLDGIMLVAFSPDGKSLAAAGWHGTVTIWEIVTCRIRAKTENMSSFIGN